MNNQIVLSPKEEMSILLEGDFDQNSYSKIIKVALFQSLAINTKLPDWIKFMPGMSGKKYRYFINNLISMIDKPQYFEIGTWAGSTACSAIYDNKVTALCVDNWSQFLNNEYKFLGAADPKKEFILNTKKASSEKTNFKFIESDFRELDYARLGQFNIYFFDGPHEEKDHYDGIVITQPALDDIFIFIVDDWNYPEVRNGTHKALKKLNIKIISKIEIKTTQNDKDPQLLKFHFGDWHNGYFIAVCQKQV